MILPSQNPTQFCLFLRTVTYTNCGYCGHKITHLVGYKDPNQKLQLWDQNRSQMSPALFSGGILDTFQYLRLLVRGEQIGHFTCSQPQLWQSIWLGWPMAIWRSECHADTSSEPVVRIMLMSSKKASSFIWRSVKRKTTWTRKWMSTQKLWIIKG